MCQWFIYYQITTNIVPEFTSYPNTHTVLTLACWLFSDHTSRTLYLMISAWSSTSKYVEITYFTSIPNYLLLSYFYTNPYKMALVLV